MAGVRRLEHAELQVPDVDEAVAFYTDTMGLVEVARDGDTVYLGCGLDETFDLALSPGGTGVAHFAVRTDDDAFHDAVDAVTDAGVDVERTDGDEPGQERGARFDLPAERLTMELVTVDETRYHNPAGVGALPTAAGVNPDRGGVAPVDLSHITAMTPDPEADVAFLTDVLDFAVSDVAVTGDGDWAMAFTRAGANHHDVALFDHPDDSLHHLAWELTDVGHITSLSDHLAANGTHLEMSPVRHGPGSNVAAYFQGPGGNRSEITTEVQTVDPDAEITVHDVDEVPFCVWSGQSPPESFRDGS